MNKKKELKAVTFHNLDIIKVGLNYEGVVVFDV